MSLLDELTGVETASDPALIGHDGDGESRATQQPDGIEAPRVDRQVGIGSEISQLVENGPIAIEKDGWAHQDITGT